MTHLDNAKRAHAHHARQLTIPIGGAPATASTGNNAPATAPAPAPVTTSPAPAPPPPSSAPAPPPPVVSTPAPAPPPASVTQSTITTSVPDRTLTVTSTSSAPTTSSVARVITTSSTVDPLLASTSSVRGASTIFNTILTRVSSSAVASLAAASAATDSDGSPSAGTVVGAVAGALVGVVVLSGLIGYLFRAKFGKSKEEEEDDDPFSRGNFRRESTRLPDDFDDGMSEISGGSHARSNTMQNLGRSDSAGPRPPTFIERHIYNTQPSPGFQPGQVVNPAYYGNMGFPSQTPLVGDAGGWGVAAGYHQSQPHYANSQAGSAYGDGLSRAGTVRSDYGQHADPYSSHGHSNALHGVREEDELPSRSGTPVDANPQTAYYHHGSRNTSTDQSSAGGATVGGGGISYNGARANIPGVRSRMSVRNGGYEEYDMPQRGERPLSNVSDAYGGM